MDALLKLLILNFPDEENFTKQLEERFSEMEPGEYSEWLREMTFRNTLGEVQEFLLGIPLKPIMVDTEFADFWMSLTVAQRIYYRMMEFC